MVPNMHSFTNKSYSQYHTQPQHIEQSCLPVVRSGQNLKLPPAQKEILLRMESHNTLFDDLKRKSKSKSKVALTQMDSHEQ